MTLEGATIIDRALKDRRGTIVSVSEDGTVLVSWRRGQVTAVTPVPGRYDVIVHAHEPRAERESNPETPTARAATNLDERES